MLAGCTNDKDITEIIPQSMDSSMETPNEVEQNDTVLQKEKIQSSPNMITEEQMQNVSEIYYAYFTLDEPERILYLELLDILTKRQENIMVSTTDAEQLNLS